MSAITLDAKEREKFALYLRQEAVTNEGIADQMGKWGHKPIAENILMQALSYIILANDLSRKGSLK